MCKNLFVFCLVSFYWFFMFFVLSILSRRNPFWGLLGLLGALTSFAYWSALKVFNYSLLSTHYSLIKSFPFISLCRICTHSNHLPQA